MEKKCKGCKKYDRGEGCYCNPTVNSQKSTDTVPEDKEVVQMQDREGNYYDDLPNGVQEWEKEFDEAFKCVSEQERVIWGAKYGFTPNGIKSFIKALLQSDRERIRKIIETKKGDDEAYSLWNDTLDEIIRSLTNE